MGRFFAQLALVLALLLSGARAHAYSCFYEAFLRHLTGIDPAGYAHARSVLFMADGANAQHSVGFHVWSQHRDIVVYQTDLKSPRMSMPGEGTGKFVSMPLDVTQPFRELHDNQFDQIVMKEGLCTHGNAECCCGLNYSAKSLLPFLREVARVLDKNDPTAQANLHGRMTLADGGTNTRQVLEKAAAQIESEFPTLHVEVVEAENGDLLGVRISVRH